MQKTFDGSTAVEIAFDENTMTAKEVNGVLKVGAKGTVPEALPQEASALKSGNLPTSGWTSVDAPLWTGAQGNDYDGNVLFNLGVTWESPDVMPTTGWTFSYYSRMYPEDKNTISSAWKRSGNGVRKYFSGTDFSLYVAYNGDVCFSTNSLNLGSNYYILTELTPVAFS